MLRGRGGEGESLLPLVDPLYRRVAPVGVGAVAGVASGTGPVVDEGAVPGGGCLWGGLGSSGVGLVAGQIGFFVGGGQSWVVGWVVGFGARWVLSPSHLVVLSVHGGLRAGGVGWQAVVVVAGLVVVVVMVVVVVVVAVALVVGWVVLVVGVGVVVVVVVRVCPQDPLVLRRDKGVGHHLQPLGLQGSLDSGGGFGVGFDGDRG